MKPEVPIKSGFLTDCFCARRMYCYTGIPGVIKKAKRQYNKLVRRKVRIECKNEKKNGGVIIPK